MNRYWFKTALQCLSRGGKNSAWINFTKVKFILEQVLEQFSALFSPTVLGFFCWVFLVFVCFVLVVLLFFFSYSFCSTLNHQPLIIACSYKHALLPGRSPFFFT